MPATHEKDFGAWVKSRLQRSDKKIAALSAETGIVYPTLSRLLNRGRAGKPIRPEPETVTLIGEALVRMGVIGSVSEAQIAAGFIPENHIAVPAGIPELERIPVSPGTATIHRNIERLANNPDSMRVLDALTKQFLREQGINPDEDDGGVTIGKKAE